MGSQRLEKCSSRFDSKDHLEMIIAFCERGISEIYFFSFVVRVIHVESSSDSAPQCAKMCLVNYRNRICHCLKAIEFHEGIYESENND